MTLNIITCRLKKDYKDIKNHIKNHLELGLKDLCKIESQNKKTEALGGKEVLLT